ncbi:polysaccharide deacetylase family protein [Alishewanella longhuensis]
MVITFDDSYENNFTTAHPILQEFGFPYTIFISPGAIDERVGPVLSWPQVKQMADDGVLVANHAMWHEHMARPEQGESEADWLKRMKKVFCRPNNASKKKPDKAINGWLILMVNLAMR